MALTRRGFLAASGSVAAAAIVASIAEACGGSDVTAAPPAQGSVRGTVVDAQGRPQPIGRIYLLQKSGLNEGVYADVDVSGAFNFGTVPTGQYQLRFWAGSEASVPEPLANPVRITVTADTPVVVKFTIEVGVADSEGVEIYAGDNFYQVQPFGAVNGTVTVAVGTLVCWYNVGTTDHTITGGPWKDSGVLHEADNFMWTADRAGTFPYQCAIHGPQMQATLIVR